MKKRKIVKELSRLAGRHDVRKGHKFRLEDADPGDTSGVKSEAHARKLLPMGTEMLAHMQEELYAQDRWALLLIFPGHGRGGQGRRDQARHVRGQPAGLRGALVQGPEP